jgi:hypothetical protein
MTQMPKLNWHAGLALAAMLLAGCATSTVESRKQERASAYAALPSEMKTLVDNGQIRRGMNMDAVYIAWGKPAQVLQQEDQNGASTIWLYEGGWWEETRYWTYRQVVGRGDQVYLERYLESDYQPRSYVSAEIVFIKGVVNSWRTLPQPAH